MAKKKTVSAASYTTVHAQMRGLKEEQLLDLIQAEHDRGEKARPDLLARLVGRYNRVRGAKVSRVVLGLLSTRGKRDVRAALGSNR